MLEVGTLASLWVTASKTKPMRVKHLSAVLSDLEVSAQLLVRTLEGDQGLQGRDVFICVGVGNEMWQQNRTTLFKKYNLIDCDPNGWWTAMPKDGNLVDACQITAELASGNEFSVEGLWGTQSDDGRFFQTGKVGDWVLRSRENPKDVWIVRGDLFATTYEVKA